MAAAAAAVQAVVPNAEHADHYAVRLLFSKLSANRPASWRDDQPVSAWEGVVCDPQSGGVTQIVLKNARLRGTLYDRVRLPSLQCFDLQYHALSRDFNLSNLPPQLRKLELNRRGANDGQPGLTGTVDVAKWPRTLTHINISCCDYAAASIDWKALPPTLVHLFLADNPQLSGPVDFAALPRCMRFFSIQNCAFVGRAVLDELPPRIERLLLHGNAALEFVCASGDPSRFPCAQIDKESQAKLALIKVTMPAATWSAALGVDTAISIGGDEFWRHFMVSRAGAATTAPAAAPAASACQRCGQLARENLGLSTELADMAHENSMLRQRVAALEQQLQRQHVASLFQPGQPHRWNFAALSLAELQPGERRAVPTTSPPFLLVRQLFARGGSHTGSGGVPAPVAGFVIDSVEVIRPRFLHSFEERCDRLALNRGQGGGLFNPPAASFSAEQLRVLIELKGAFLERAPGAPASFPNLLWCWHGTKAATVDAVTNGLVSVRATDSGWFAAGIYTALQPEYACAYAAGRFFSVPVPADGRYPVLLCVAAVGLAHPVTVEDVDTSTERGQQGHVKYYGAPLRPTFDAHIVPVSERAGCRVVPAAQAQFHELVVDQESAVLPVAVVWVKKQSSGTANEVVQLFDTVNGV